MSRPDRIRGLTKICWSWTVCSHWAIRISPVSETIFRTLKPFLTKSRSKAGAGLSGQADGLAVVVSGSGDVSADGLVADDVSVDLSGSGSILVTANTTLVADLSGSGVITYRGHPTVAMEISGSGSVSRAD